MREFFLSAGADSAPGTINNNGNFYFTLIIYLAAFLLIIAALLYFRKYFLNRLGRAKSGTYMKIIDSLVIGPDKQIILIETKNKILVVGVTPQRMETLSEFSKEEFGAINNGGNDNGDGAYDNNSGGNFLSVLRGKFDFKNGGKNEK